MTTPNAGEQRTVPGLDTLGLGSSLFIRYAASGAILVLLVAYLEPGAFGEGGALHWIPHKLVGSEVLIVSFLPAFPLHSREGYCMKAAGPAKIRQVLIEEGFAGES